MPRPRKPARLYFRKDEEQWVIRDGDRQVRTGYGHGKLGEAEAALERYLASRKPPIRRGPAHPAELTVGEVLAHYVDFKTSLPKAEGLQGAGASTLAGGVAALVPFWANLTCDAVKGTTCRAYERARAIPREVTITTSKGNTLTRTHSAGSATVRRELGVLQAALNHAHGEGLLVHPLKVTLPASGVSRERWLTRSEAAKLLRYASPHIRRFILISLYTGRRATAVLDLTWHRVDLESGVIRFRAEGEAETNKRRGRARIPRQLVAHLRRWQKRPQGTHVVMFRGKRLDNVKRGIARARRADRCYAPCPQTLGHHLGRHGWAAEHRGCGGVFRHVAGDDPQALLAP